MKLSMAMLGALFAAVAAAVEVDTLNEIGRAHV